MHITNCTIQLSNGHKRQTLPSRIPTGFKKQNIQIPGLARVHKGHMLRVPRVLFADVATLPSSCK